jgi:hypothetical protein
MAPGSELKLLEVRGATKGERWHRTILVRTFCMLGTRFAMAFRFLELFVRFLVFSVLLLLFTVLLFIVVVIIFISIIVVVRHNFRSRNFRSS